MANIALRTTRLPWRVLLAAGLVAAILSLSSLTNAFETESLLGIPEQSDSLALAELEAMLEK